jgi:hypothetical protein
VSIFIISVITCSSTFPDLIFKTEGSNNEGSNNEGSNNDNIDKDDEVKEEESFELEEEIEDIEKVMRLSNDAMILDEKLPESQKEKNSHLKDLRKHPHVKKFFEGENPNISDLPELNEALVEARKSKKRELSRAIRNANNESSTNSPRDKSDSNFRESDSNFRESDSSFRESKNTSNKEDYHNDSDYKLDNSLSDWLVDILNNF